MNKTPFRTVRSPAIPLGLSNCDTDQIVPARFLSRARSEGYGGQLFHDLRFDGTRERPEFALNRPGLRDARILLAGPNFGCGSSRESAVWALVDHGIKVVVAPSFGDIFFGNASKNGLLAIVLPPPDVERLAAIAEDPSRPAIEVDLEAQEVRAAGAAFRFEIDPLRKRMLASGQDEIELTLSHEAQLAAFERRYVAARPWLG